MFHQVIRRAMAAALFGISGGYGGSIRRKILPPDHEPRTPAPVLQPGDTFSKQAHRQNQAQQRRKKV